jgi:hypothetical protein
VNAAASQIQPLHRARVASGSVLAPLCAVLLLSGPARLVYQVTWVRLLGLIFGVTIYAISTVLAAFMAGLAIGSTLGGRLADTTRSLTRRVAIQPRKRKRPPNLCPRLYYAIGWSSA